MPKEGCFVKLSALPLTQTGSVESSPSDNTQQSYIGVVVAEKVLLAQKS